MPPGSGGRYPGETFWTGACAQEYHVFKKNAFDQDYMCSKLLLKNGSGASFRYLWYLGSFSENFGNYDQNKYLGVLVAGILESVSNFLE